MNRSHTPSFALRSAARGLAIAVTMGWACASSAQSLQANVGYFPGALLSFPAFVAQEQGFFKSNGLEVTLVPIPNGAAMTAALASGSIHFANNSYDNLSMAVAKGLPLKAVVGATVKLPLALVVREGKALPNKATGYPKVMQDFGDSKMGVIGLGISTHFLTEKLFENAGMQPRNVSYIAVGLPASARPALKNSSIDAYMSLWPLPSILEATGEGFIAINFVKDDGPPLLRDLEYNGWWATDKTIGGNAEMVKRFARANEQAFCWYRDPKNFDAVVAILKKHVPVADLKDDQYRQMVRDMLPAYGVTITNKSIETWQALLLEKKHITKALTRDELVAPTAPQAMKCT